MDQLGHEVVVYITAHPETAVLIIGLTAFAESFAFVSFVVPGFSILIAAGALVQKGAIEPYGALAAASAGAILGDAISYIIGWRFGDALPGMWPFRKHPGALERGVLFFRKWGWPSVFIGRFFGPLRAFVPLVAGMYRMPTGQFYAANIISALIWAPALLYSGYFIGAVLHNGWTLEEKVLVFTAAATAVLGLAMLSRRIFKA